MTILEIRPVPKPRMTRADTWKKRDCVVRYWEFKDQLTLLAKIKKLQIPNNHLHLIFIFAVPQSWSKKKQKEMIGKPHQDKPDIDNLTKAFFDCLVEKDQVIWDVRASKYWGEKDMIVVREAGPFYINVE